MAVEAKDLEAYAGTHGDGSTVHLKVNPEDGALFIDGSAAIPAGEDRFFNPLYYTDVEFVRGPDGAIEEVRFRLGQLGTRPYRREGP